MENETNMSVRPAIYFIKNVLGENLVGAEVGVHLAENAKNIYNFLNPKALFLIDPWKNYIDPDSFEVIGESQRIIAEERMKDCKNIKFLRMTSLEAVNFVPDGIDFVYIDGNHSFVSVLLDMKAWFEKIKHGGILAGHDYHDSMPQVQMAVDSFGKVKNLRIYSDLQDWWIVKQ